MTRKEQTIAHIRARREIHKAVFGVTPRRRRMPRPIPPVAIRSEYLKVVINLINDKLKIAISQLNAELPALLEMAKRERGDSLGALIRRIFNDAASDRVKSLLERLARQVNEDATPAQIERMVSVIAERTSAHQRTQLLKQVKAATGVDPLLHEPDLRPRLAQFVAHNVSLIKSIPTRFFDSVEKTVMQGVRSGARADEIAEDLQDRLGVAETDAARIANDQVGKLMGELNMVRQTALGITGYTWRGMLDNRERAEHEDREGEHFEWDDPPEGGHPGEDINCRCFAEPDLSEIFGSDE